MNKKKEIEEMAKIIHGYCKAKCPDDGCDNCLEYTTAKRLYNAGCRKQSEWISIEERLPEETQDYLVVLNNEDIDIRLFNSNNDPYQTDFLMRNKFLFCDSKGDWHITDRVTHWMLLPEAPKGGAE